MLGDAYSHANHYDIPFAEAIVTGVISGLVALAGSLDYPPRVDVIVLAIPYDSAVDALRSVGDLTGKVVLDITNPLTPDYMGLTVGHDTSAAEQIAKAVPAAELVKGFNTVFAQVLAAGSGFGGGQKVTVFVASDSERAKRAARELGESMGFKVMDAGGLKNARYLEPLAGLNIYFGYGAGLGTAISPAWITRQ